MRLGVLKMKYQAALLATLLLAACDGQAKPNADAAQAGIVPALTTDAKPVAPARPEYPPNIYYDLTTFEWYAHGEALVDDSLTFAASGSPVALPLAELEHVGNYQGVDVYKHRSAIDRDSIRYVPVYEGFWLRFNAQPSQHVEPD